MQGLSGRKGVEEWIDGVWREELSASCITMCSIILYQID